MISEIVKSYHIFDNETVAKTALTIQRATHSFTKLPDYIPPLRLSAKQLLVEYRSLPREDFGFLVSRSPDGRADVCIYRKQKEG